MIRSLLTVALLAFGAAPLASQPLPVAAPEDVGMSSERLEVSGRVRRAEVEDGLIPGAVVAIARRGRVIFHEAYGYLDKPAGIPMPRDAIFPIASITKPVVTVGGLILQEEGRLSVYDPVATYLPELGARVVTVGEPDGSAGARTEPARRQPTVQDLLRHTSGFIAPVSPGPMTAQEFVDSLARTQLVRQPGTVWEYGVGFDLMGIIIERVSQQSLGAFLEERIFAPLGMHDTGFTLPSSKSGRFAKPLPLHPRTGQPQSVRDLQEPLALQCGGGCLASTAADYLRFAQMLLDGGSFGGTRILGPKTVEYMTSDHLLPGTDITRLMSGWPNEVGYGFGLSVAVRRENGVSPMMGTAGDYNWGGATGTYFWVDPQEELAVVFMGLASGGLRLRYRHLMPTLVLQAITD